MNTSESSSTSQHLNENSISLAELLAKFALRRPLYIHESSALCYQILEEFCRNLVEPYANETSVLNLNYPTLGNIQIEENGTAYVTKSQSNYRATDWLTVFAETLKSHTLWDQSPQSNTFRTLVENLPTYSNLTFDYLVKQIQIWRKTCLYLCSLVQLTETMTDKTLLKELRTRSRHAQSFKLFSHEIQVKNSKYNSNLWSSLDTSAIPLLTGDSLGSSTHKSYVQQEKEAFANWVEKWQCVNAEFSAHQVIGNALTHKRSDRLEPRYHRLLWSYRLPDPKDGQSNEGDKFEPIGSEPNNLDNNASKPIESSDGDMNSGSYMDALKSMYSTLITRPLNLLKRGLKETGLGNLNSSSSKPVAVYNNSSSANSTLKKLEQVLQQSDSG